ncbi:GntR family transcriptional regulator [Acrocarpospora catenulata]|uniref:GntR family transcriptional regulator n=1 Tax=Acrocarpospora catenulata TaxID=2836182 RepID=UPI001BDA19A4|nr:GntR family transcriptional regulator [Acrocarpospora catenulata]
MTDTMSQRPRLVAVSGGGGKQQAMAALPDRETRPPSQPPSQARPRLEPKGGPGWAILRSRCRDITEHLAHQISDGRLAQGTRMPSVQKLTHTHDLPAWAARRILRQLADRHFIRLVPGLGYVVGVPGVTPLLPREDPNTGTLYAAPCGNLPIPGVDVLLAQRQAGGDNSPTSYTPIRTADPADSALTGPDAIKRGAPTYLYAQVANIMAGRIATGRYRPGQQFASVGGLRREFAISDATARRALRELIDRGLIHNVSGWACFTGPATAGHPLPLYQQIAADLAAEIFTGSLPILHVIPLREQLKAQYDVSFRTIDEAIRLLESLGWIMRIDNRRPIAAPPKLWPVFRDGSPAPDR